MSTIKIGTDNDISITNNNLTFAEGREEIAQVLRQNLRVFFQEWFLDQRIGITYFEDILTKAPNLARVDAIFKNAILTSPGVIELLEFELELTTSRQLNLRFTARSTEGIINFDEAVL
jgi:hypothetical protein